MIQTTWAVLAILLLWAAIVAMRRRREGMVREAWQPPRPPRRAGPSGSDDDIDRGALEQAEKEVRDLETDAKGRPLDDVVGDDWGPGTPKPPYT